MAESPVALVLVGTNHRHAPIGVREELAARTHGRDLIEAMAAEDAGARGGRPLHLQPLRDRDGRRRRGRDARRRRAPPGRLRPPLARRDRAAAVHARGHGRRRAPVRRGRRPGLDGAGRGADPQPDPRRLRRCAGDGLDRPGLQPAVPPGAGGWQASAPRDGDRRAQRLGGVGGRTGGARPAGVAGRRRGADRRRREGRRTGRDQPARPRRPQDHGDQSQRGPRRGAGRAVRWPVAGLERPPGRGRRVRCRRLFDAVRRPRDRGRLARPAAAAACWSTWRCLATSIPPVQRSRA